MSFERRIAAHRRLARKGRGGPRTTAGKSRVSVNALRHGLSVTTRNPAPLAAIACLARDICAGDQNPLLFEQALLIAQYEVVLARARAQRLAALERVHDTTHRIESRDQVAAICQSIPIIERLARYERRALLGRNRALNNFVAIKSSPGFN
jgi:hypothetical protein